MSRSYSHLHYLQLHVYWFPWTMHISNIYAHINWNSHQGISPINVTTTKKKPFKKKHHLSRKKTKWKNVINFTMLLIFIPVTTPLLVPTTSTHKKNKTNIRLVPKVSHLHKPKPFPLLFHKSPNIQLSDKRKNRRLFLTLKLKQVHHLSHHKL